MLKPYFLQGVAPPSPPQKKNHVLACSTTANENSSSHATANEDARHVSLLTSCIFLEVVNKLDTRIYGVLAEDISVRWVHLFT